MGSSDLDHGDWERRQSDKERVVGRRFFFLFRVLLDKRRWRTGPRERALAGAWSGEDVRVRENVSTAVVLAGGGSDGCNEG